VCTGAGKRIALFIEAFVTSVQIEETCPTPTSCARRLAPLKLHAAWKREFLDAPLLHCRSLELVAELAAAWNKIGTCFSASQWAHRFEPMSFFIASGNVSHQIFLPCPSKDAHLRGKAITTPAFPHFYQLPWLIPAATRTGQIDLGSPDRTEKRTGTMSWRYENKIKIA